MSAGWYCLLQKQTWGPPFTSPAQGRLQDPEVTVHPSLWPTLTSPLLEVRWVARTESFLDLPFVPPSPPPLTHRTVLGSALPPPCSPPAAGELVSTCIWSCVRVFPPPPPTPTPRPEPACGSVPHRVKDKILLTYEVPHGPALSPLTSPPTAVSLSARPHPHKHLTLPPPYLLIFGSF